MLKKIKKYLSDSDYRFLTNAYHDLNHWMDDEKYLKKYFHALMGYDLDLDDPKTFNEKLQWLKLHDRKPIYTTMADKYAVKEYVASIIGNEYVVPAFGVWDRFEDIDFKSLPDQFVLKCTHDSGGLVICTDKEQIDWDKAKHKIQKCLKNNYFWRGREWPYKDIKPRILAEKYMVDEETKELRDYKFFCFDGVPLYLFIATDRQKGDDQVKFDYFDIDFNRLPMRQAIHPNSTYDIPKPDTYDEMVDIASKLSKGIPQVRIDLYEVNGRVYFGEYTFYHHCGLVPFIPEKYDRIFGDHITLPKRSD